MMRALIMSVLCLTGAASVHGQSRFTVRGAVIEVSDGTAIVGAEVEIVDGGRTETDAAGEFRLTGIPAGSYRLRVRALGFETTAQTIDIRGDTTLILRLDVEPLRLGELEARARTVSLRGRVTDAVSGAAVTADIFVRPGGQTRTSATGQFRVRGVPAGDTVVVFIESFGYVPQTIMLTPDADTALTVALRADPVTHRMMEIQLENLEKRARAVPYRRRHIDGDEMTNGTAYDVLRYQFGVESAACILIDDNLRGSTAIGELKLIPAHELSRMELIDGGTMVRVYTRDYLRQLVSGRIELRPINIIKGFTVHCA
jgi:hypothetical protein